MGLVNPLANTISHWKKPAGSMPSDVRQRFSNHFFPGSAGHVSEERIHEVYDERYPDNIYGLRASFPKPVLEKILTASLNIPHDTLALQLNVDRYQRTGDLSSFSSNAISSQRVRIIRSCQWIPLNNPVYSPSTPVEKRSMQIAYRIEAVIKDRIKSGEKPEEALQNVRDLALTNGLFLPTREEEAAIISKQSTVPPRNLTSEIETEKSKQPLGSSNLAQVITIENDSKNPFVESVSPVASQKSSTKVPISTVPTIIIDPSSPSTKTSSRQRSDSLQDEIVVQISSPSSQSESSSQASSPSTSGSERNPKKRKKQQ